MTILKKSSKTATKLKKNVTRSYSTLNEVDGELLLFCERLKRSRSSIITEALQDLFVKYAPKDT